MEEAEEVAEAEEAARGQCRREEEEEEGPPDLQSRTLATRLAQSARRTRPPAGARARARPSLCALPRVRVPSRRSASRLLQRAVAAARRLRVPPPLPPTGTRAARPVRRRQAGVAPPRLRIGAAVRLRARRESAWRSSASCSLLNSSPRTSSSRSERPFSIPSDARVRIVVHSRCY